MFREREAEQLGYRLGRWLGIRLADWLWAIKPLRPRLKRWALKGTPWQ